MDLTSLSEEELESKIEAAEDAKDCATLAAVLQHCCAAEQEETAEACADALLRLTTGSAVADAVAGAKGADICAATCAALKAFGSEPSITEVCVGLVGNLAADLEACKALGTHGVAELLVAAMSEHTDEPSLQEQGCLAAAALTTECEENKALLLAAGAETSVRSAATIRCVAGVSCARHAALHAAARGIQRCRGPPLLCSAAQQRRASFDTCAPRRAARSSWRAAGRATCRS